MTLKDIRELARQQGVKNYSKLKKAELIRTIQTHEGNAPCFQTITDCREGDCLWRSDCQE
jgi:Rho termination factor, N-terminal domain